MDRDKDMGLVNIAAAGYGQESPLSLNAMPGGRSIINKRFRNQDLGSFLTKRSASTSSSHPSPCTHGHRDDAHVNSIAEEVLEEPVEVVVEDTQEQPELEGIDILLGN
uniref:Uncharacterized protein n=1 Tax=Oryza punctata TaxID=4537 RepID=A0A0E0L1I5_ORYPU